MADNHTPDSKLALKGRLSDRRALGVGWLWVNGPVTLFILGPMFERSLRTTVILFDDPWTLAIEHPLLPILAGLGCYFAWRGLRAKTRPDSVLAHAGEEE